MKGSAQHCCKTGLQRRDAPIAHAFDEHSEVLESAQLHTYDNIRCWQHQLHTQLEMLDFAGEVQPEAIAGANCTARFDTHEPNCDCVFCAGLQPHADPDAAAQNALDNTTKTKG